MFIALKYKFIFFLIVLLFTGCFLTQNTESQIKLWEEVMNNYQGYDDLNETIKKNGHRLTGSLNAEKSEEFIFEKLKTYGLDPVYMGFETETWVRGDVKLWLTASDNDTKLETVSLAFSPLYSDLRAQISDVGNGLKKDFEKHKDSIKGKIVLVNLDLVSPEDSTDQNLHRSEKTALAIEYGADGVIFINPHKGGILLTGTASVTGSLISIPAVCISNEDGSSIRNRLLTGEKIIAKILMNNQSKIIKARNIIATIKGKKYPEEKIIIGGHLDSWDLAVGAMDNGFGVYSILDIARVFAKTNTQCERSVVFAFWMGEEQGLHGSKSYIKSCMDNGDLQNIRYYINLDMTGNPSGFDLQGRDEMVNAFKQIGETIQNIDSTFKNELKSEASFHSDHASFALEGIPTLQIIGNLDPVVYKYYHSNMDNFDLVNKDHMKYTSSVLAVALYELANLNKIEAKKLNSDQTREFYEKAGLKEKMIIGNEWKWN